jgi:DNA-directed RNA polymerase specialized sigma24 family protein
MDSAQARLIEAFHYEQQPVSRIAESLGISERAAEGRLRRARRKLRELLESAMKKRGGR